MYPANQNINLSFTWTLFLGFECLALIWQVNFLIIAYYYGTFEHQYKYLNRMTSTSIMGIRDINLNFIVLTVNSKTAFSRVKFDRSSNATKKWKRVNWHRQETKAMVSLNLDKWKLKMPTGYWQHLLTYLGP